MGEKVRFTSLLTEATEQYVYIDNLARISRNRRKYSLADMVGKLIEQYI